jgi:hypothetical protein
MGWADLTNIKTGKKPAYAPKNYKSLEPCIDTKSKYAGEYIGSGIGLTSHPLYRSGVCINYCDNFDHCRNCNSENTLCIYFYYYADLVGKEAIYELECLDCHHFTAYQYMD